MPYEWIIARRYLMPEGRVTFVFVMALMSIIGVAVGVASLITVLSVMNGFGDDLRSKILQGQSHLIYRARMGGLPDVTGLPEAFETDPNVEAAAAVYELVGLAQGEYEEQPQTVIIRGIHPKQHQEVSGVIDQLIFGDFSRLEKKPASKSDQQDDTGTESKPVSIFDLETVDTPGIVIGQEFAVSLGAYIDRNATREQIKMALEPILGQHIRLTAPPRDIGPAGPDYRSQEFEVVGIFSYGHYDFDRSWVFISLEEAQYLSSAPKELTHIEMRLKNHSPNATEKTAQRVYEIGHQLVADTVNDKIIDVRNPEDDAWLKAATDKARNGDASAIKGLEEIHGYPLEWMALNRVFFEALLIEKKMMGYILAIIIFVATFSILSTLFMVVMIKTRDIGILRTMGVSRGGILRLFVLVGLIIGCLGTFFGTGLGLVLCEIIENVGIKLPGDGQIYYLKYLPVAVRPLDILNVVVYTVSISFLATILPALRAAKMDPTRCLRSV